MDAAGAPVSSTTSEVTSVAMWDRRIGKEFCAKKQVYSTVYVMLDFVGTTFKYAHLDIVEKVLTGHCGWHSVCQGVNVFR